MIKKKICLIGAFAVGKTSLVKRFVEGIYSDDYLSTVGVKVDQRNVTANGSEIRLMIWDLAGRDEFQAVRKSYLNGAAGFVYVVDGTRRETLEAMRLEMEEIEEKFPSLPAVVLVNKHDLAESWELDEASLSPLRERELPVHFTSALTGENVADSFTELAERMLRGER